MPSSAKRLAQAVAAVFGAAALCAPAIAAAPAQQLPCTITDRDNGEVWMLSDASRSTKRAFASGGSLTLRGQEDIYALYLVWDAPAPPALLLQSGGKAQRSAHGYLHDFIALESPGKEVTFSFEGAATLCEITALSAGAPPDFVQCWQPAEGPCDILLLPTHADDEHLFFGGIMPTAAATPGCEVQVAYMVNHNTEPYRPHELLNGLWRVGVRRYPVMPDFPDVYCASLEHAKTIYDEQQILEYQITLLRQFRPQVVVGHDLNGEYGHGAHCLNAHTLVRSAKAALDVAQHPASAAAYGLWQPKKVYLHLYPEREVTLDYNRPLEHFDGKTAYEMAVYGFDAHRSQHTYFQMEPAGSYDCRRFGLLYTTVGADAQNDLFEHITLYATQREEQAQQRAQAAASERAAASEQASSAASRAAKTFFAPQATNDRMFAFVGSRAEFIALGAGTAGLAAGLVYGLLRHRAKRRSRPKK